MRYSDIELFRMSEPELNELKEQLRFNEFCDWAVERIQWLIELSTMESNWMEADANHLRNYRIRAIKFYQQKRGK